MKRIISIILSFCMAMSITTAFAENADTVGADKTVINTDLLTEDNVLYKALQKNDKGMSLFSGTPSNDEITADFDVVLGFDMSGGMSKFDYNGDKLWIDNFAVLSEQVPDGTRFSVVTDTSTEFSENLEIQIETVKDLQYSGENNIINLLDTCLNVFDDTVDRNKIVIASTPTVLDANALQSKMDELLSYGIIPFVFVLNSEKDQTLEEIDYIYQCSSDLELRLAMSDLYLSFIEFSNHTTFTADAESVELYSALMPNDYKSDKHKFGSMNQAGELMIAILNMYGCVPMVATSGSSYNLFDGYNRDAAQLFLDGKNAQFSDICSNAQKSSMISVWNNIFANIHNKYTTNQSKEEIVEKNLKRRFPILQYNYSNNSLSDGSIMTQGQADKAYVFDTYKYLMASVANAGVLSDSVEYGTNSVTITTKYPSSYNLVTDDTVYKNELDGKDGGINWDSVGNTLITIASGTDDRKFVIGSSVNYTDGLPDILNANKVYHTTIYKDVQPGHWARDYIFRVTNADITQGTGNQQFEPDKPLTRCQFVIMLLRSVGEAELNDTSTQDQHWAAKYMEKANDYNLLTDYTDSTHWDDDITREEAAYMASQMYIVNMEDLKQPTNVYNYLTDDRDYKEVAGFEFEDDNAISNEEYRQAVYHMAINNILNGYPNGRFEPNPDSPNPENRNNHGCLTRAEGCKIISKCLFTLDENLPTILANIEDPNSDTPAIELAVNEDGREINDIVFGNSNTVTYDISIERPNSKTKYRYMIEVFGDTKNISTIVTSGGTPISCVSDTMKNIFVATEAVDNCRVKITKNSGNPTVGLRIKAINAPQEIVFNHHEVDSNGKKHYFLFDDHPEHIRECDLMDGRYGLSNQLNQGTALTKFEHLEPGIYSLCSSHCVDSYLSSGFPMISSNTYFDLVFYNSTIPNNVQITKLGYGGDKTENDVWVEYWYDKTSYENIGSVSPHWLSDILFEHRGLSTLLTKGNDWGSMELEIEFEVTQGTVDIATVAYHNKPTNDQFNEWNSQGKINAPYETLETVKGKGKASTQLSSNLEYYIDDSVITEGKETRLPVLVTNMFYKRKLDMFSINCSPFSFNNHMNAVGSAIVPLEYDGYGIINRQADNNPNGDIIEPTYDNWKLDDYHTFHLNKEGWLPNEEFSKEFISDLANKTDAEKQAEFLDLTQVDEGQNGEKLTIVSASNPGYGLMHTYNIKIHNIGSAKTFSYLFQGGGNCKVAWSAWKDNVKYDGQNAIAIGETNVIEAAHTILPENSDVTIIIDVVMICGSNPITHNAFALNVPETDLKEENGYRYYKQSAQNPLYNYYKIKDYPQD